MVLTNEDRGRIVSQLGRLTLTILNLNNSYCETFSLCCTNGMSLFSEKKTSWGRLDFLAHRKYGHVVLFEN